MKKKIIWIIGSNATGKTTQAKLLHKTLGNGVMKSYQFEENGHKIKYTTFGNTIGNVGLVGDNQCTGADTLNSKEGLEMSLIYCLDLCDIVVVDGIMATATWIDIFTQFETVDVYLILFQFDDVIDNLRRVVERRVCKQIDKGGNDGADIADFNNIVEYQLSQLEDKTIKNVSGKFSGFKSMYEKVKGRCKKHTQINAGWDIGRIQNVVNNFIQDEMPF